ncbi:MAG: hypothetical protein ACK55Z_05635, partial [bacterium]
EQNNFEETYLQILESLQAPDPVEIKINFESQSITPEERKMITRAITAVVRLAGNHMAQKSVGPVIDDNGKKKMVVFVRSNKNLHGAQYDSSKREILIGQMRNVTAVAHEAMHAMQHQLKYGATESDLFGAVRTDGERTVPSKSVGIG